MTTAGASVSLPGVCALQEQAASGSRFCFGLATAADGPELRAFGCSLDAPGAIRFAFDRGPDYFAALGVEGRHSDVLVCRNAGTGRVLATGHRSIKTMFVDGAPVQAGYLGGLRVAENARSGLVLARGYGFLRELHARRPVPFYLTTIMEDNQPAKSMLTSGRCGLPRYHDFGRFCCMAISLRSGREDLSRIEAVSSCRRLSRNRPARMPALPGDGDQLCVRRAAAADAPAVIAFLQREGRLRQFFPEYQATDFGGGSGLLSHLDWGDLLLAWCGSELLGIVAAWDQRAFRQWRVTGYAAWLRLLRRPCNLLAKLKHMPILPRAGSPLNYFVLSLICVRNSDGAIFDALLEELVRQNRHRYDFFLAGLHERDPLLPELVTRPHVPLTSRLYVVAWEDGAEAVEKLDRSLVPYLELGAL